jgi:hypothetical protein
VFVLAWGAGTEPRGRDGGGDPSTDPHSG